jgi:DNA polymerase
MPSVPARKPTPDRPKSLAALKAAAKDCRACPLWRNATQKVFGEGIKSARVMLVGEQPGDQEDLGGRPFIGPAGKLLDQALADARLDRAVIYVTNAVKHFKYELRGKRRLHKSPNQREILACHQWLENELRTVQPDLIVAMGGTAARAILGRTTSIQTNRGQTLRIEDPAGGGTFNVLLTFHPSYLLRLRSPDRERIYNEFVKDLKLAKKLLGRQ